MENKFVDTPTVAKVINTFTYDTILDLTKYAEKTIEKRNRRVSQTKKLNPAIAGELVLTAIERLIRGKRSCRKDRCIEKGAETLYEIVKCCTRWVIFGLHGNQIQHLRNHPDEAAQSINPQGDGDEGITYSEEFIYSLTEDMDTLWSTRAATPEEEVHVTQLLNMFYERLDEEARAILDLYLEEGINLEGISETLGVHISKVSRLVRDFRGWLQWDALAPLVRRDFDERGVQILELYIEKGKTRGEIKEALNLATSEIDKVLNAYRRLAKPKSE